MARVLVVDDALFMRTVLKTMLSDLGHEVIGEAADGHQAIDKYNELLPDIVTMDITMPELDGVGAVQAIKQKHPTAKIIMCSAMGQQQMIVGAIEAGAMDFIVKPFNKDRIGDAMDKILAAKVSG